MLAVTSSSRGFEITLTGAATLSQAHLIQRGFGTGDRTPGKSLLSRVLTATPVASCRTKIVDSQIEDRSTSLIRQIHDVAQDRLAGSLDTQTSRKPGAPFATGGQPDRGDLLAVPDRHPGPWFHKGRDALGEHFSLTQRIAAGKFAHG